MSAGISERPITGSQIRAIHVALSAKGIEDADYRRLLAEFGDGAESCKDLTRRQASDLLARLGRPLRNPPAGGRPKAPRAPAQPKFEGVAELATPLQRSLIAELAAEVEWHPQGGLESWCRASFGFRRPATRAQAAKAIEGLKAVKRRQARGAGPEPAA